MRLFVLCLTSVALWAVGAAAPLPSNVPVSTPLHPQQMWRSGGGGFEPTVSVDWGVSAGVSNTTTTLQVVANPLLRRECPVAKQAWQSLRDLEATHVRYVPWFPYPW